ncbi:N-acetyltransferase domain-containing protein [Favolaschia claudopus]|uniref:N-acetyltransferase domain-containing protein n=1 Tax=Favolaschia claudopus TaxID=2862362 RepID=A0AAW0C1J6_9AGAR
MEISVRKLINPSDDEIDALVSMLDRAFVNSSSTIQSSGWLFRFLTDGKRELAAKYVYRGHVLAGLLEGEVWVAGQSGTNAIRAAAVWFPPGIDALVTEAQRSAAEWDQFISKLSQEKRTWWSDYFLPTTEEASASLIGRHMGLKSWHLLLLGTDPDHQGKGLSTALIRAVESKASAERVSMVVGTSELTNVAYYQKLGFVVRGAVPIDIGDDQLMLTTLTKP